MANFKRTKRPQKGHKAAPSSSLPRLELSLTDKWQQNHVLFHVQCDMSSPLQFHLEAENGFVHVEFCPRNKATYAFPYSDTRNHDTMDPFEEC